MTDNYKSRDDDGGSAARGKRRESEGDGGDERGHGLGEGYNSR